MTFSFNSAPPPPPHPHLLTMLTRISAVRRAATLGLTRGLISSIPRPAPSALVFNMSVRFQSSSSSSHDNDNSPDLSSSTVTSNEPSTTNASLELHRVDLAHGSFFALHRPLLGIANGPMFAPPNNHMINDEEFEGRFKMALPLYIILPLTTMRIDSLSTRREHECTNAGHYGGTIGNTSSFFFYFEPELVTPF